MSCIGGGITNVVPLTRIKEKIVPHNYVTTNQFESQTMPGVVVILKKMTEGRRIELRKLTAPLQKRVREIMRAQKVIDETTEDKRDMVLWMELQDEFDGLMVEQIDPTWIKWGVKNVEGLTIDGKSLGVEDFMEWPSMLYKEVVAAVQEEAELNGAERKNSPSSTTSGEQADSTRKLSIVESAKSEGGGETETAPSTSKVM